MSTIVVFAVIVNIVLAFKLWWDHRAKNKFKRIINKKKSVAIDGALYIVSVCLLKFIFQDVSYIGAIGLVLCASSYRWIMFDMIFAKMNWGVFEFYGTSSVLDIFLSKMDKKWELLDNIIKFIPAIIGILLYVYFN